MTDMTEGNAVHDVAIVGYGPVAAALALLLTGQGVSVLVVERSETVCPYPRAAHLDDEILRILQTLGLADMIDGFAKPIRYEYFDRTWKKFLELRFRPGVSDQGHPFDAMFFQPAFETAARELVAGRSATVLLGHEVVSAEQDDESVTLTTKELATGQERQHRASYVVGCDGARSFIRKAMGTQMEDLNGTQPWYVVDVRLTGDVDPGSTMFEWCHPDRTVTYVPLSGPYRRFEFGVKADDSLEELQTAEKAWGLLGPWLQPGDADLLRNDVYKFHALLARGWRNGRFLIAGDAAHQMPPKMGQGLCSGFRDVMNLGWKLARVLQGAPAELLDTYESERAPAARQYVEISAYLARQIATAAAAAEGAPEFSGEAEAIVAPPQILGSDDLRALDPLVGTLSRQPFLSDGRRLDDLIGGYRFAVIIDRELLATLDNDRALLESIDAQIIVADDPLLADYLTDVGRSALVVRPDRYLAGSATTPAQLSELLHQLARSLAAPSMSAI